MPAPKPATTRWSRRHTLPHPTPCGRIFAAAAVLVAAGGAVWLPMAAWLAAPASVALPDIASLPQILAVKTPSATTRVLRRTTVHGLAADDRRGANCPGGFRLFDRVIASDGIRTRRRTPKAEQLVARLANRALTTSVIVCADLLWRTQRSASRVSLLLPVGGQRVPGTPAAGGVGCWR